MTREDGTVGRPPWATLALVALLVIGTLYAGGAAREATREAEARLAEAQVYFEEHPYVELDARTSRHIGATRASEIRDAYYAERRQRGLPLLPDRIKHRAQRAFDTLVADAFERIDELPLWRSAVRDASSAGPAYLTHVVFHDGWLALGVVLFFLTVAGSALEDAWGTALFSGFCVVATLAGAVSFASFHADAATPWIGASGLCAALVGAYAVRFARDRVYVLGGLAFPFWLLPPAFVVAEVLAVRRVPLTDLGAFAELVPTAALAVPMALGVVAAVATRALGLDDRLALRAADVALVANPVLERAMRAREAGDDEQAFLLLQAALKEAPGNRDAALALWDLAQALDRAREAAPVMVRLVRDALQQGRADEAVAHWLALTGQVGEVAADPVLLVRIAERLLDAAHPENAVSALRRAVSGSGRPLASALAVRTVRLARDLDPDLTLRAAQSALSDRDLGPGDRQELETLVATLGDRAQTVSTAPEPASPSDTPGAPVVATAPAAPTRDDPLPAASEPVAIADSVAVDLELDPGSGPAPGTEDLSALDPHAVGVDAVQEEATAASDFGDPGSIEGADEDEMSRWNDPGLIEDLSSELEDLQGEWDEGDFSLESHGAVSLDPDEPGTAAGPEAVSGPSDASGSELNAPAEPSAPDATDPGQTGWEAPDGLIEVSEEAAQRAEPSEPTPPAASPEPEPLPAPPAPVAPERALRVLDVVPLVLEDESIKFEVDGKGKSRVPYARIDALAVAVVEGLGPKPVIVFDIALNWRSGAGEALKVLRLRSDRFNPRRLFSDEATALDALRRLVAALLDQSGGVPLPDADRVLPETAAGFARFESLAAYESEVFCAHGG